MQPWHSLPSTRWWPPSPATRIRAFRRPRRRAAWRRLAPTAWEGDEGAGRLSILLHQFTDVLIWILIVAALISGVLLDEWIDAGVILAIVVLNAILGFVQEARAESALARLKEMSAPEAVVVRDGGERRVPSAEVVPGDLLVLEAGDRVPADARLVTAVRLEAEESALTGESFPAAKQVPPVAEGVSLGDRRSMLFSGTSVASGRGRAIVTSTGGDTEVGRLAEVLSQEEPPPPLKIELARVGRRLAIICLATAGLVFLTGLLRGKAAEAMFLTSVALAVAAIPEGLPAVVTITLSGGVQRMADRHAIVRRLAAVESLGAATVICTDKTGTLTRNEIRVQEVVLEGLRGPAGSLPAAEGQVRRFVEVSALCNDSRAAAGAFLGDPTEVALLIAVADTGADVEEIRRRLPRIDEFAFDSRRKRMSTIHEAGGSRLVAVKGAPEVLVDRCRLVEGPDGPVPLSDARAAAVLEEATRLAAGGLRTLALAYREAGDLPADADGVESGLTLVGLVGMSDGVRPEAAGGGGRGAAGRHHRGDGDRRPRGHRPGRGRRGGHPRPRRRGASRGASAGDDDRGTGRRGPPLPGVLAHRPARQGEDRRGLAAAGGDRGHDRRRGERRPGAPRRRHRRGHGQRHRRGQGRRRHGAHRRQLRQHRLGGPGGAGDLRQPQDGGPLPALVQRQRGARDVPGVPGVRGPGRSAAGGAAALGEPGHRRPAGAGPGHGPAGARRHAPAPGSQP